MKALVTGVAGFIGSGIARRLLAEGWNVKGIDSLTDYYSEHLKRQNLAGLTSPNFEFVEADILDAELESLVAGVDFIFHQAGQPGVRKSWGADFRIYIDANISATQQLLEAAKKSSTLRKFVYASSSSVYGNANRYPVLESDTPRPLSPYGVTKLAAEHLCTLYAENFGTPTVSLRYFTVYGPGQRPDMAFTRFVKAAVLDEEITIFGRGTQIRDFTYVNDIVNANILAATGETAPGSVFNVSGGSSISVNESLELLSSLAGARLNITYVAAVPGDVARTGGSTQAFRDAVGWWPVVTLEEGLAAHLA